MERLRLTDLHTATRFLRDLYELDELPSFQKRLLARLPTVVPCDMVIYCENNVRTKESRGFANLPGAFDEKDARIYARHVHESPLLRAYRRGRGSAVKYSDFLTRRQFHDTGLYNEFFRTRGIEFRIAKGLPGASGLVTAVFLRRQRGKGQPPSVGGKIDPGLAYRLTRDTGALVMHVLGTAEAKFRGVTV
jgi:hypothetical protein